MISNIHYVLKHYHFGLSVLEYPSVALESLILRPFWNLFTLCTLNNNNVLKVSYSKSAYSITLVYYCFVVVVHKLRLVWLIKS